MKNTFVYFCLFVCTRLLVFVCLHLLVNLFACVLFCLLACICMHLFVLFDYIGLYLQLKVDIDEWRCSVGT